MTIANAVAEIFAYAIVVATIVATVVVATAVVIAAVLVLLGSELCDIDSATVGI